MKTECHQIIKKCHLLPLRVQITEFHQKLIFMTLDLVDFGVLVIWWQKDFSENSQISRFSPTLQKQNDNNRLTLNNQVLC